MNTSDQESTPLVRARDIHKSFGGRTILQGINFTLRHSSVVTLVGPNGAGKTTLVRILLGLVDADQGTVERRPKLRVGYMPQRVSVQPTLPLTVERFLRTSSAGKRESIVPILQRLRIEHLQNQQLIAISGGEFQRVLLARALMQQPQLLILDEPAQGVDLSGQAELYRLISGLRDEFQCGVLMISHDLQLVMSATDEVVCLNHHICCHGKPEQVSNHPAFIELFGPNLQQGLAVYTHDHNHEHDIAGHIKPGKAN